MFKKPINNGVNVNINDDNVNINQESKVKEIKENKKELNESKGNKTEDIVVSTGSILENKLKRQENLAEYLDNYFNS